MADDQSSVISSPGGRPQEAILATKLYVPAEQLHLVARPRLTALLDQGLSSRLVLISAPAGFGKTTLISQWLARAPLASTQRDGNGPPSAPGTRVGWLSLDERDNDPARFFRYLIAALQKISPAIGQTAQAMAQSAQPPPPEALVTTVINDLAAERSPFVIVLDDYHVIKTMAIHQQMAFLVENQPPHMHLVVASREDPPLPLSRLRVRGQVVEIRQADLQFTADETQDFLRHAAQTELAPDDLLALHRRSEGWIASLQLLALSLRGCADARQLVQSFTGSSRYVLDYLVEEVFQRQTPEVRRFLLTTSLLDRLTAPLCDVMTGRTDSRAVLLSLERANLFIVPLDESRDWYRYHHLFSDLLRHRLGIEPQGDLAILHGRASRWYADHGFPADAIHHALEAKDWELAADLIDGVTGALLKRGEILTLLSWFGALPQDVVRARPLLCCGYSWPLLLAGQIGAAEGYLALAESGAAGDSALLGAVASAQAYAARLRGDGRRAMELSQRSLTLLPADDWDTRSVVTMNLGMAYWYAGSLDRAQQTMTEAAEAAQRSGNLYSAVTARIFLARVQAARGGLRAAATTYAQIIEQAKGLPVAVLAHADLARLLYEQNDLGAAADHAQKAVTIGKASGNAEFHLAGVRTLALVEMAQGDGNAARRGLEEGNRLAQCPGISPTARWYALAYHVLITLGLRDVDEASRLVAQIPPADAAVPVAEYALLSLAQARLLLAQGQPSAAAGILAKRYETTSSAGFAWYATETRLLQALTVPTTEEALAFLMQALPLAEREGCVRMFVDLGEPMVRLLREAAARRIAPEYLGRLLAACRVETHRGEKHPPVHIEQPLAEPLSERELSVLHMLAEHTNREVGAALYISDNTVKAHLKSIYGKLGVGSRRDAIATARTLGLLS